MIVWELPVPGFLLTDSSFSGLFSQNPDTELMSLQPGTKLMQQQPV